MFALLETAIAFSAAMLAVSLFISAAVQWISNVGRYRSITLIDMLRTLIHGFRVYHNDPQAVAADQPDATPAQKQACTDTEMTFVNDVLSDPVLHARDVKLAYQDRPGMLAKQIDYIDAQDLAALVYNIATNPAHAPPAQRGHAGSRSTDNLEPWKPRVDAVRAPTRIEEMIAQAGNPDVDIRLPDEWVGGSAAAPKEYATTANFAAYVGRWFSTIEGTAAQRYKLLMRRLTFFVAALTVVVLNIDGIYILSELYNKTSARAVLGQRLDDLSLVASRLAKEPLPAPDGSPAVAQGDKALLLDMQKSLAVLSDAGLALGWKDSWIVKRYSAYRGLGADPSPPSLGRLILEILYWLAGLLFSCVLLSLGAPFWVNTLSRLINLKNEVQQRKESEIRRDDGATGPSPQQAPFQSQRQDLGLPGSELAT